MIIITTAMIDGDDIKEDKGLVPVEVISGQMSYAISLLRSQMLLADALACVKASSLTHAERL